MGLEVFRDEPHWMTFVDVDRIEALQVSRQVHETYMSWQVTVELYAGSRFTRDFKAVGASSALARHDPDAWNALVDAARVEALDFARGLIDGELPNDPPDPDAERF